MSLRRNPEAAAAAPRAGKGGASAREGKGGRRGTGVWEEEEREGGRRRLEKRGAGVWGRKRREEGGILNKNLICGLHGE